MTTITSKITHGITLGHSYGSPLTLTVSGEVTASGVAIAAASTYTDPVVVNQGTIIGTQGYGIRFGNGGYVDNAGGLIQGHYAGVAITKAGTVMNSGTITGFQGVLITNSGGAGGTVTNTGAIIATGAFGSGINITAAAAAVTNSGTITATTGAGRGISLYTGGNVNNTGVIQGYGYGVYIKGGAGTVTNTGAITADHEYYFYGIRLLAGGTVINTGGLIRGNGYGVDVEGTLGTVINSGTIAGGNYGIYLRAGGTVIDSGTISSTYVAVAFGGTGGNLLALESGYSLSGPVQVAGSGNTLELVGATGAVTVNFNKSGAGFTNFGTVAFGAASGNNETLKISNTAALPGTIAGFGAPHAIVDLTQLTDPASAVVNFASDTNRLTITEGVKSVTLQLDSDDYSGVVWQPGTDGSGGTSLSVACFARGTHILVEGGEVAIEKLAVGDRVVTLSGEARPIRWIGRRAYDGRFIASNRAVLPIHIAAGALGEGVPLRDLWVSPGHSLYLDGWLVPSRHLINGATIVQPEAVAAVEYFHIELDSHDILIAGGAPAESYTDCDNRLMFANGADYARLYPHDQRPRWAFCAPRLEPGDAALTAIRAALLERVAMLGYPLDLDPDLHLVIDGETVRPASIAGVVHHFEIPAGCHAVWLASRSAVPAEIDAASRDIRPLGVPVERIVLSDGDLSIEAWHGHATFVEGFHGNEVSHRWTNGMARLPDGLLAPFPTSLTLEVHLIPSALPYRVALPRSTLAAA